MPNRPHAPTMTAADFRAILDTAGLTGVRAARLLGVNQSTVNRWINGETTIDQEKARLIRERLAPGALADRHSRRLAILDRLNRKGPLTTNQLTAELGCPRPAVERALVHPWFVRRTRGIGARYELSPAGRLAAREGATS